MDVLCVLPARLASRRIARKPLQFIAGKPLVEWAWRAALRVAEFDRVVVATDSDEIASRVSAFGGEAVLTDATHVSGTDRVCEAARSLGVGETDIVVNFQADEPFVDAATVGRAVAVLRTGTGDVVTLAAPIGSVDEWRSDGVVKVVVGQDGRALYFSRAAIPHSRGGPPPFESEEPLFLRHIGIYAYRMETLNMWAAMPESSLERIERLEQLRALEAGITIQVEVGPPTQPGVDVPADLERAAQYLEGGVSTITVE
jgi:3-deoxy-manno-octulosonate cytidylyltransferase (CMP-KDO synthetase)